MADDTYSPDRIELESIRIAELRLWADAATLQAFLDRTINLDGADRYEIADEKAPVVLYLFYEIAGSSGQESSLLGSNRKLFVTIKVRKGGEANDANPVLFCPYAFVQDYEKLTVLREGLGYPVWWSEIIGDSPANRAVGKELTFSIRTEVYPFGEQTWKREEIIGVSLKGGREGKNGLREPRRTLQLLQIRDPVRTEMAKLREPIRAEIKGEGKLTLPDRPTSATVTVTGGFRSLDLATDLGLKTDKIELTDNEFDILEADKLEFTFQRQKDLRRAPLGPAFIESRVDPRSPPPYAFESVRVRGFKLTADRERLDLLVDALLNANENLGDPRQNFRYRVASAEVMVEHLYYEKMRCTGPETEFRKSADYSDQNELVIRLLVGRTEEDSPTATEPRVFCPFLFVDNWASMVTGREVIGLWKRMGNFLGSAVNARVLESNGGSITSSDTLDCVVRDVTSDKQILHASFPRQDSRFDEAQALSELRGTSARGVLPWVQQDLADSADFRGNFARDWLKLSGEEYITIQRAYLPRPGNSAYRPWIEIRYRIQTFRVHPTLGNATVNFGGFVDRKLAELMTNGTELGSLTSVESGIDVSSGEINVAKLLGLAGDGANPVIANGWYEAEGSFDAEVIDPYA